MSSQRVRERAPSLNVCWPKVCYWKLSILGKFKSKIEILSTHNILCQKYAAVCQKIATFCRSTVFNLRRRCRPIWLTGWPRPRTCWEPRRRPVSRGIWSATSQRRTSTRWREMTSYWMTPRWSAIAPRTDGPLHGMWRHRDTAPRTYWWRHQ